ncbi:cytochrome P450 [Fodinisporobacter ferrooxydans]|uniref:Cytochrome P450 n=1 Tax=Fodinisporobacter ferrooxydans TaxID=2901836 RepID=A0ABY4CT32_9BACL|nr:cytochrome P450 [Alicyclobacillaceae bacterium MYW30-H2]
MVKNCSHENTYKTETIDPTAKEFLANPYPTYHWLRSHDPIHWLSLPGQEGWMITRYQDVFDILKNPRFQKRIAASNVFRRFRPFVKLQEHMFLFQNPPDHTRIRTFVSKVFNQHTQHLQEHVQEISDYLIDSKQDAGTMDVISDYAFPLPAIVIARVLGVPMDDCERFRQWSNTLIQSIDLIRTDTTLYKGAEVAGELIEYFQYLIKKRREDPKHDLISALLAETKQENPLNEDELLATCILLLNAGHENTVNLIGNGMLLLLSNVDQLEQLKQNPSLISSAVEEFLRYETPTQMTVRFATEDMRLGNQFIKKGQQVHLFLGAANRDPEVFFEPDRLDIARTSNQHLAFGWGIHFCLGAALARTEGQIAVQTLLRRTSKLELLIDEPQWRGLIGFRGLDTLPISFSNL